MAASARLYHGRKGGLMQAHHPHKRRAHGTHAPCPHAPMSAQSSRQVCSNPQLDLRLEPCSSSAAQPLSGQPGPVKPGPMHWGPVHRPMQRPMLGPCSGHHQHCLSCSRLAGGLRAGTTSAASRAGAVAGAIVPQRCGSCRRAFLQARDTIPFLRCGAWPPCALPGRTAAVLGH